MSQNKKIAVLFPGIGYTCDKPLLYYAGKLAAGEGYTVIPVKYGNFPSNVKGNAVKMHECFLSALEQTEEILKDVDWKEYKDILFISKSVGTVVSSAFAEKKGISVRSILFTPVNETFDFAGKNAIAFHGTADPWAADEEVERGCEILSIPLHVTEEANHSLETGDVERDLQNMLKTMKIVKKYIKKTSSGGCTCY